MSRSGIRSSRAWHGVLPAAVLATALAAGCPQSINEVCDPNTCPDGCCDGNQCRVGTAAAACGQGGTACSVCVTGSGQICSNGACMYADGGPGGGGDGSLGGDSGTDTDSGSSPMDSGTLFDAGGTPDSGVITPDASPPDAGCIPKCSGSGCGPDGCNGSCGTCPAGESCTAGQCAGSGNDAGVCNPGPCLGPTIAAGGVFSCALNSAGALRCWGSNPYGGLGNNSQTDSPTPVDVQGLTTGVGAVSTGDWHACALLSGGLQCWGYDNSGQIGDGMTNDDWTPTNVLQMSSGVAQVAAGSVHTCALTTAGGVKCWGSNLFGQIGDGSGVDQHIATNVSGLTSGATWVTASGHFSCAIVAGGAAKCWGDDTFGQLGDGNTGSTSLSPVSVNGLTGATAIGAGNDTACALVGGSVSCWGCNQFGEVGNGTTSANPVLSPTPVTGLGGTVTAIAVGGGHACAILAGGTVQCWGDNAFGQIGDNTITTRNTATNVTGLPAPVLEIAAGAVHTCARLSNGAVYCWGQGTMGQLGTGGSSNSSVPVAVSSL